MNFTVGEPTPTPPPTPPPMPTPTPGGLPLPPPPSGFGASGYSDTQIEVDWTDLNGVDEYQVGYRKEGGSWEYISTSQIGPTPTPDVGPEGEVIIHGLECDTAYDTRIRSYGDGLTYAEDWGPWSGIDGATTHSCSPTPTPPPTPPPTPTPNPSVSINGLASTIPNGGSDSFTINASGLDTDESYRLTAGTADDQIGFPGSSDEDVVGTIIIVGVPGVSEEDPCEAGTVGMNVPTGSSSYSWSLTLNACTPGTGTLTAKLYEIVDDGGDDLLDSDSQTVTVPGAPLEPPATPVGLSLAATAAKSIDASWNSQSGIQNHQVRRKVAGGNWTYHLTDSSATSYTITGLECNTLYYVEVRAQGDGTEHSDAWSDWSDQRSRRTLGCDPTPTPTPTPAPTPTPTPVGVRNLTIHDDGIATWDAPQESVAGYRIRVKNQGDSNWDYIHDQTSSADKRHGIRDFTFNQSYIVSIGTKKSSGSSYGSWVERSWTLPEFSSAVDISIPSECRGTSPQTPLRYMQTLENPITARGGYAHTPTLKLVWVPLNINGITAVYMARITRIKELSDGGVGCVFMRAYIDSVPGATELSVSGKIHLQTYPEAPGWIHQEASINKQCSRCNEARWQSDPLIVSLASLVAGGGQEDTDLIVRAYLEAEYTFIVGESEDDHALSFRFVEPATS